MLHSMRLQPGPFRRIASGRKTIELRLWDEKRRLLRPGDEIEFSCIADESQKLRARVVALHRFADFAALYRILPLDRCGYAPEALAEANPRDMEVYYTPAQQKQYGVVGIEFVLLP